ncbi:hypothetical protein AAC387_Pa01g2389 [Persea americana]
MSLFQETMAEKALSQWKSPENIVGSEPGGLFRQVAGKGTGFRRLAGEGPSSGRSRSTAGPTDDDVAVVDGIESDDEVDRGYDDAGESEDADFDELESEFNASDDGDDEIDDGDSEDEGVRPRRVVSVGFDEGSSGGAGRGDEGNVAGPSKRYEWREVPVDGYARRKRVGIPCEVLPVTKKKQGRQSEVRLRRPRLVSARLGDDEHLRAFLLFFLGRCLFANTTGNRASGTLIRYGFGSKCRPKCLPARLSCTPQASQWYPNANLRSFADILPPEMVERIKALGMRPGEQGYRFILNELKNQEPYRGGLDDEVVVVQEGRTLFERDIRLHAPQVAVRLVVSRVARQLGHHQVVPAEKSVMHRSYPGWGLKAFKCRHPCRKEIKNWRRKGRKATFGVDASAWSDYE